MGLLDKVKNMLFEDEIVEVEERPKKEEPKEEKKNIFRRRRGEEGISTPEKVTVEDNKVIVEDTHEEEKEEVKVKEESPVVKEEPSVKEPIKDFDINDFDVEATKKLQALDEDLVEVLDTKDMVPEEYHYSETTITQKPLYKGTGDPTRVASYSNVEPHPIYQHVEVRKTFQPTPIISPIYGVLDKNYKKEEIVDRKDTKKTLSFEATRVSIDNVREKAYGGLSNDLDLIGDDPIEEHKEEEKEEVISSDLLDLNEDNTPVVNKVTLADAEEYFNDLGLEYNVDYKDSKVEKTKGKHVKEEDNSVKDFDLDDTLDIEKDYNKDEDIVQEEVKDEDSKEVQLESTKTDTKLEDNLFDLIDAMYEDKE